MTAAARWRASRWADSLRGREAAQADERTAESRQLDLLNAEWARAATGVPRWQALVESRRLPGRFESLEEFRRRVPPTTRADVQRAREELTSRGPAPDFWRMTGGSTAMPVQLPAWHSETRHLRPDTWLGRGWYGVTPASRLFLIWGHAHLLGAGWRAKLRAWRVRASDRILGYHRFSAYDMRPERLRAAASALLRFRPEYLIGYSSALDRFARENEDLSGPLRALGLKAVIGTGEGFPFPDSAARLEALFGSPVSMEYGAVETGVIAHTHPAGGYRVMWNSYLLETEPSATGHVLRVTSLYPRCFPLIRYEIGDEIAREPGGPLIGVRRFERVIGRCNDAITLPDGFVVHSELFSHAVRPCPAVRGFQIVQRGDSIRVLYVSDAPPAAADLEGILFRLGRIHPVLGRAALERVDSLASSVAGKTRMVVREPAP